MLAMWRSGPAFPSHGLRWRAIRGCCAVQGRALPYMCRQSLAAVGPMHASALCIMSLSNMRQVQSSNVGRSPSPDARRAR
eukprot:scaffold1044_cov120-Isochrysis_galbana.AAC.29